MTDQGRKYLSDILQAIELIESFTSEITEFDNYLSDFKTQSAVERQLGIIGEAVSKFEKLFPDSAFSNVQSIKGFRNRLIHAYDTLDQSISHSPFLPFVFISSLLGPSSPHRARKYNT